MAYKLTLHIPDGKAIILDEVFETHQDVADRLDAIISEGTEYSGKVIAFGKVERI